MEMKTDGGGGKIVQVHGGHILRSSSRKDRHSKVYTAKGPRDRRVRLAAQTAIQFYDVQDRLGYDRPSKAVDWLINKAKDAIDKLEELPPWNPIDDSSITDPNLVDLGQKLEPSSSCGYFVKNPSCFSSSALISPQSVNVQSIEDTMKLFHPTSSITFQNYQMVETGDLCLSLQSLRNPNSSQNSATNQVVFSGSAPVSFSATFPRMMDWNGEGRVESISGISQRETFQSSLSNFVRAWDEERPPPLPAGDLRNSPVSQPSPVSRSQFSPGGLSGFQIPAKFYGHEIGAGSSDPFSVSLDSTSGTHTRN